MKTLGSVSETDWREDAGENSETRIVDVSEKDWFLEGFLVGYRKEKDRREKDRKQRIKALEEERKKKEIDSEKILTEWKREEREKFDNKMREDLNDMKKTLGTVMEEAMKLRLEVKELKNEIKERKLSPALDLAPAPCPAPDLAPASPQVKENVLKEEFNDVTLAQHNTVQNIIQYNT